MGISTAPSSLRERARLALHRGIFSGELQPGTLYSVASLADRIGVSATPVRDALSDLAHSGLAVILPQRGFMISEVTEADLEEILELRLLIEVPAFEKSMATLTPDDIEECRLHATRGATAAAKGDVVGFLDTDKAFHAALLRGVGNRRIMEVIDRLRDQVHLYGVTRFSSDKVAAAAADHLNLLATAQQGDIRSASEEFQRHLTRPWFTTQGTAASTQR